MIRILVPILLMTCLCWSCKDSSTSDNSTSDKAAPPTKEAAPPEKKDEQIREPLYPAKPIEQLQIIYQNCDFVDFTFYELPMSMSFDNPGAIQQIMRFLSLTPPTQNQNCKPTGRAFFQKAGEDMAVAEFYLQDGCNYFVFMENGKPAFANLLTPEGITWYRNTLARTLPGTQSQ